MRTGPEHKIKTPVDTSSLGDLAVREKVAALEKRVRQLTKARSQIGTIVTNIVPIFGSCESSENLCPIKVLSPVAGTIVGVAAYVPDWDDSSGKLSFSLEVHSENGGRAGVIHSITGVRNSYTPNAKISRGDMLYLLLMSPFPTSHFVILIDPEHDLSKAYKIVTEKTE